MNDSGLPLSKSAPSDSTGTLPPFPRADRGSSPRMTRRITTPQEVAMSDKRSGKKDKKAAELKTVPGTASAVVSDLTAKPPKKKSK